MTTSVPAATHHHAHGPANRRRRIMPTAAPLFVSHPRVAPHAALIVLHDASGLGEDVEWRCRDLARHGYLAIAPYLYYDTGGREFRAADDATAFAALSLLRLDDLRADVAAALEHLREKVELPQARVGVLGHGLGGYLAMTAAAEHQLACAIAVDPLDASALPWRNSPSLADLLPRVHVPSLGVAESTDTSARELIHHLGARRDQRPITETAFHTQESAGWDEVVRFVGEHC